MAGSRVRQLHPSVRAAPRRRWLRALGLAGGLVAAALAPAAAQLVELRGREIVAIEYVGLATLAPDSLAFYLGISEGGAYDPAKLNLAIYDLWKRQLVEDIEIEALPEGEGVKLVVRIDERPTLRSVDYVGLKRLERTDIVDRITRDGLRVREGDPLNLGQLTLLERAIEDLYAEKGFRLADAQYQIEKLSPTESRVTFTIDEGDKVRIEDIDFEGNTVFGDRRLRFAMKKTKESGFITKLLKRDIYKPATFEEDIDKVRELYRKEGYKNVVIGDLKIDVRPTREGVPPERERRRLFLTVPIEEGGRWKLGDITISGNERFPDEILLRQFEKPRGGWLRSNVIDEGLETIDELYKNTGYLFSRVTTAIEERPEQTADVAVLVEEGDQYRVREIEFEGNRKTKDKVLRREMGIQEGMVVNQGALRNSLLRIRQLEFFEIDQDDPVNFDLDHEEKMVDLTIKGQEGDRTEMQFGAGFSEIDGFFGQFSFRSRNFLGRGETLGVSIQSGARQDVYDLSYFVPWFLDRPQSVGANFFSRRLDFDLLTGQSLRQDTLGGTLTYGRRLGLFRNVSISYSRFESKDQRRQFSLAGELVEQEFERDVSSVRLSHVFDRRDSRIEPTRGYRYTAGIEYTGGFLGGTTNFIRPQASFSIFKPLTQGNLMTVGGFNVEAGVIEPFGDQELFFLDRFYLGGENSVRGFRFRSLWVRDENDETVLDEFGFPLGGDSFVQFNFEYHLVLGGPFRVLAFLDAGNVYGESQSFDLGRLRWSTGLELRVNVPLFGAPLRFIYATNPDELPDDRFETFQFSIGTSF